MIIDKNFEDRVLACLYSSTEFSTSAAQHLKASYFDSALQHNLAKMAIDFFVKYRVKMSKIGFVEGVKELLATKVISEKDISIYTEEYKRLLAIDISDWKFILEKLIVFIKSKEIRLLIEDSVKRHLPKNDFESIESGMRKIANISTLESIKPYLYFDSEEISERGRRRELCAFDASIGISTGIKKMDEHMPQRGFYKKNLYTFLAPPKAGKTMALLWFANAAAIQGFNVAYFTLETSTEVLSDRADAMNSGIEINKLPLYFKEAEEKLKLIGASGEVIFYEYPTKRLTVEEIERQLRKLEIERKTTIDKLVVDYADIMKPSKSYSDKLYEQASIYEDLRALSTVFNIPVVTASQVNRVGAGKEIITGKDTSGTWEKIMVSDAIISLSATEADMRRGEMKIHFAECRNIARKTLRIKTAYNFGKFYKEFMSEEFEGSVEGVGI